MYALAVARVERKHAKLHLSRSYMKQWYRDELNKLIARSKKA
jgi:hypothetical protein